MVYKIISKFFIVFFFALCATAQGADSIHLMGPFPYQPPEARPFIKITSTSITAAWGAGTNDASTRYECQNTTASTSLPPSIGVLSWESSGLIPETAYSFRARAWDDNATPPSVTEWTDLGSIHTTGRIKAQGIPISDGDHISGMPDLSFSFRSSSPIDAASCTVLVNDVPVTDGLSANTRFDSISSSSGVTTVLYTPKSLLSGNGRKITVSISDSAGALYCESASNLAIRDSSDTELRITSPALCYPNPFDPGQGDMKIAYHLSADGEIAIFIIDAAGRVILKRPVHPGMNGARYGYNEFLWDGKNAFGETVSNDVYLICIADGSGKILGKTRTMVLK